MPYLLLFAFCLGLLWLFYRDGKERKTVSRGVWVVIMWAIIYGSRSITEWVSGDYMDPLQAASSDEGNLFEAFISLSLILVGLLVLIARGIRPSAVIRNNVWLFIFYAFWLMSILWSDYPFITFKRLFRELGNVVMVLVVLTETEPGQAIRAVCERVAFVCIPLSVLLIRYFPELGRVYKGYDQSEPMWVGVASHKNTLGVLAVVGALFLLLDVIDRWRAAPRPRPDAVFIARVIVLLMSWHLLVVANSVTSLLCGIIGSVMLFVLSGTSIRKKLVSVEVIGVLIVTVLLLLNSMMNIKGALLESVGRDETLTTRTDIWPILIDSQESPLVGAGFNTFWTGKRLVQLSEKVGHIIQAHNGYLETYLNGGSVGVILLGAVLLAAYLRIRKSLVLGLPESSIRYVLLLIAIFYNFSEASFNKSGILWLVTVYAIMEYRPAYRMQPSMTKTVFSSSISPASSATIR